MAVFRFGLIMLVAMSGRCQNQVNLALLVTVEAKRRVLVTLDQRLNQNLPYKDTADFEKIVSGLRKAGLPE